MVFAKKFVVADVEKNILSLREKESVYKFKKSKESWAWMPFSLGNKLHLGQAFSLVLQDTVLRLRKQRGEQISSFLQFHQAPFLQHKKFLSEKQISKNFLHDAYQYLSQDYIHFLEDIKRLGVCFDEKGSEASFFESKQLHTRQLFQELFKKSLIFKSKELVYWNLGLQTLVGKDDVKFQKEKRKIYRIRYFVDTKKHCMTIATEHPELIFADAALGVNPLDKRYKKFVGKKVIIPIINKAIPVVADEKVDMTKDDGVMRICPAHDLLSLEIAKEHNLPLDLYAMRLDGKFSSLAGVFAGKKIEDFFQNIVQYLDDISNLDTVYRDDVEVPYCKKTGVELQRISMDQWFLKPSQETVDKLSDALAFGEVSVSPIELKEKMENLLLTDLSLCISRHYKIGSCLPLLTVDGESKIVSTDQILTAFKSNAEKKQSLMIGLILLNLYWDGRLSKVFSVEQVIDLLFSSSLENPEESTLMHYTKLFEKIERLPAALKKELVQLQAIDKDISKSKFSLDKKKDFSFVALVDALDHTFLCEKSGDLYGFSLDMLFPASKVEIEELYFDSSFFVVLSDYLGGVNKKYSYALQGRDNFLIFVQKLLFDMEYGNKVPFEFVDFHGSVFEKRGKKMGLVEDELVFVSAILDQYGADALRLFLLSYPQDKSSFVFNLEDISVGSLLLDKLWNASRFVFKEIEKVENVSFSDFSLLEKLLKKHMGEYEVFDYWMLDIIKDFVEEWESVATFESLHVFIKKAKFFIEYGFCGWYLELYKLRKGEYSHLVLAYVLLSLLKLLHPALPMLTEQLRQELGVGGVLAKEGFSFDFELPPKNYKVHLFLDIVKKFTELKSESAQKHEVVDLYIQANPDFLDEISQYEDIFKIFLKAEEVFYLKRHEEMPEDIPVAHVIDIFLALRAHGFVKKKDQLVDIQEKLSEKKEYLQYLRTLISSAAMNGRRDIVVEKEQELGQVKSDIDMLEFEVSKIKVR